ncbi:RHS repeat-associated core domain-containing protein [uncultured Robinsoniella sp.]|uniref:RHS repeat domain-containing protein n=1 Tax=uncultured Robinsoniella sp. TaxID=904190 RepID=UPI00374F9398
MCTKNYITYTYDGNGNQTSRSDGTDKSVFTYDGSGALTRAVVKNGTGTDTETYAYDWQGNRILKKTGSEEIHYVLDTSNWISYVIAETDASGQLTTHYTRGDDMLISQEQNSADAYYIYDGHGSVRMLADENSEISDRYDHDAYGVLTAKTGTTVNPYLYAGEQYDQTTQLYYLRARYMDPAGGRFVSMDRYAGSIFDPVSLHKYLYGNGNPVIYRDPTGYFSMSDMIGSFGILGALNSIPTSNLLAGLGILFSGVLLTQVVITPRDMMEGYFVNPFPTNVGQGILNGNTAIWEVFENSYLDTADQILGRVLEVFGSNVDSQAVFEVRGDGTSWAEKKKTQGKSRASEKDEPGSTYEQVDDKGNVTSKTKYGANVKPEYRDDYTGKAHYDKKTGQYLKPHRHNYKYNDKGQPICEEVVPVPK